MQKMIFLKFAVKSSHLLKNMIWMILEKLDMAVFMIKKDHSQEQSLMITNQGYRSKLTLVDCSHGM